MEYEKIKQLMDDMGSSNLESINIEFPDGTKISIKNSQKEEKIIVDSSKVVQTSKKEEIIHEEIKKEKTLDGKVVKAPMVGTVYLQPSPSSKTYVEIGKEVKKGETLCIIEAMKLMNEIESDFSGKIKEILVKDGEAVEYGKPLFVIE